MGSAELAESDHPYLVRKGVKSYGLKKVKYDGLEVLLVPLVDEFGKFGRFREFILTREEQIKFY